MENIFQSNSKHGISTGKYIDNMNNANHILILEIIFAQCATHSSLSTSAQNLIFGKGVEFHFITSTEKYEIKSDYHSNSIPVPDSNYQFTAHRY